jgi:hypothetical protein
MNPAMRPKMIQPMMDIGSLRVADYRHHFCLQQSAQRSLVQTKRDDKGERYRKHHTSF